MVVIVFASPGNSHKREARVPPAQGNLELKLRALRNPGGKANCPIPRVPDEERLPTAGTVCRVSVGQDKGVAS